MLSELIESSDHENTGFLARLSRGEQWDRIPFPEPDLYVGKSPRWEQDKLLSWLKKNGRQL
ncbi:hypothetical protein [Cellvibrio polysaccharolyticus]|nr:hypothetical protein [Cellvibrio polysaccharolyticus]